MSDCSCFCSKCCSSETISPDDFPHGGVPKKLLEKFADLSLLEPPKMLPKVLLLFSSTDQKCLNKMMSSSTHFHVSDRLSFFFPLKQTKLEC